MDCQVWDRPQLPEVHTGANRRAVMVIFLVDKKLSLCRLHSASAVSYPCFPDEGCALVEVTATALTVMIIFIT